jgi:1-deoxy-D-xylulose 5-phosphate reductoisomerase
VAVAAFVAGQIRFGDIAVCIEAAIDRVVRGELTLDAVRAADRDARLAATAAVENRALGAKA